jgi:D-lactate dehydrogenase
MKVLMFDVRESEKSFFENKNFNGFEFTFFEDNLSKSTKIDKTLLDDADVISVYRSSLLNEDILKRFKNLRAIVTRSFGFNHIDLSYCENKHIAVMNAGQYGDDAVAQYALGLILALERNIKPAIIDIFQNKINPKSYEGQILNNMTIGIIGCGRVGIKLAQIMKAFNMTTYVSSYKETPQFEKICNIVSFDELLRLSDIIVLHMPFSKDNYQIIGEDEFKKMKNGVLIINTSCVELINIKSLYDNLISGKVKGAGLDILDNDFLANKSFDIGNETMNSKNNYEITKKLLNLKNVIVTPHIAYNTKDTIDYILETTINNLRDFCKGINTNRIC